MSAARSCQDGTVASFRDETGVSGQTASAGWCRLCQQDDVGGKTVPDRLGQNRCAFFREAQRRDDMVDAECKEWPLSEGGIGPRDDMTQVGDGPDVFRACRRQDMLGRARKTGMGCIDVQGKGIRRVPGDQRPVSGSATKGAVPPVPAWTQVPASSRPCTGSCPKRTRHRGRPSIASSTVARGRSNRRSPERRIFPVSTWQSHCGHWRRHD